MIKSLKTIIHLLPGLLKSNKIQGLRIDHIDGLRDPSAYVEKLRYLAGDETYIVAEKILEQNENLPETMAFAGVNWL